jgi:ABC-type dipeptide/oligopeptide/nickel transport system permease component
MLRYIVRRLLWVVPVLVFISMVTFTLAHTVPGGPFDYEHARPPDVIANMERYYGLDKPLYEQYIQYLGNLVTKFDFGPSIRERGRSVNEIFATHLPVSAQLGLLAMVVALLIGVPLGILSALKQNTFWDYLGMGVAVFGVSVPNIVLGPLLIWVFALGLKWLPVAGWGTPAKMVMPAVALGLGSSAIIGRLTRASMLQVVREDYIRTARSKGLTERMVMVRHALKNAFIPVATILGPMFAALVTGTFVVEQIFAIPGLGRYFVNSVTNRDYPVVMGTTLLYAVFLVFANLAVDVTYAFLDPRIRYS